MYAERTATITTVMVGPRLEFSYLRILPGILKIIELVLAFLVFICVLAGPGTNFGGVGWASFVTVTAMSVTLSLLFLYLCHVIEFYNAIPWLLVEMIFCGVWAFFFFIAGCILASDATWVRYGGAWAAASFFAFAAMLCYGFDAFFKFKSWSAGEVAQQSSNGIFSAGVGRQRTDVMSNSIT